MMGWMKRSGVLAHANKAIMSTETKTSPPSPEEDEEDQLSSEEYYIAKLAPGEFEELPWRCCKAKPSDGCHKDEDKHPGSDVQGQKKLPYLPGTYQPGFAKICYYCKHYSATCGECQRMPFWKRKGGEYAAVWVRGPARSDPSSFLGIEASYENYKSIYAMIV